MPSDTSKLIARTPMRLTSFAPKLDSLVWRMKSFPDNKVENGYEDFSSYICGLLNPIAKMVIEFYKISFKK